MNGKARGIL
ncbi:putative lipoprotein, partial [Vibrio harveyi]